MKKLILITGTSFSILNLLFFIIMSFYGVHSFIISEICIIISTALMYYISISKIDNAFKISLLFILSFLGVVKYILALYLKLPLTDNFILFIILLISTLELLLSFGLKYFTKHA